MKECCSRSLAAVSPKCAPMSCSALSHHTSIGPRPQLHFVGQPPAAADSLCFLGPEPLPGAQNEVCSEEHCSQRCASQNCVKIGTNQPLPRDIPPQPSLDPSFSQGSIAMQYFETRVLFEDITRCFRWITHGKSSI